LLALTLAAAAGQAAAADLPEPRGWRRAGETETYDRKSVWQAINGAAELFVAYGFVSLRTQGYRAGKVQVTVQLYEQITPLGAFGVFQREGGAKAPPPGSCLGLKGRHYIKVLAVRGDLDASRCRGLLEALKRTLPGKTELPPELRLLPSHGQVPGSLGYARKSYLGTRRLQNCLYASYSRKGARPYTLFAVLPAPQQGAQDVWNGLAAHWKPVLRGGLEVIATKIPYTGSVALVRRGDAVLGAAGVGDLQATVTLLRGLTRPE